MLPLDSLGDNFSCDGPDCMYLTQMNKASTDRRFYRIDLLPGLFGDWALVREWGKVGRAGQTRTDWYQDEAEAKDARFALHMKKAKVGYD
ncbi:MULTISPECIES: WGR domain-containing protein [unclassified Sulfitobacter]|nr:MULTISPECIES: WGR domain-containing protein [unclassified Sulfitobacter]